MFTGGKLSFKGGVGPAVKKKKKKGKRKGVEADVPVDGEMVRVSIPVEGDEREEHKEDKEDEAGAVEQEGVDTRTEAEKRRDAHMAKYERERAKKAATKSHRERIQEMNRYLEGLSEHHGMCLVSLYRSMPLSLDSSIQLRVYRLASDHDSNLTPAFATLPDPIADIPKTSYSYM